MIFNKAGEIMLEEISSGVTDIHKMKDYKFIDMISEYLEEVDVSNSDVCPIISLEDHNVLMLKNILDVNSLQKLHRIQLELAFAVYQESKEELDETFEQKMSDFYKKENRGDYHDV